MKPLLIILILTLSACSGGKMPEGKRSLDVQYNDDSLRYESDTRKPNEDKKEQKE